MAEVKFNFNLEKTRMFSALLWERRFKISLLGRFAKIFLWSSLAVILVFCYGFFFNYNNFFSFLNLLFHLFVLFISVSISLRLFVLFFETRLKNPAMPLSISDIFQKTGKSEKADLMKRVSGYNLADFLSFSAAKSVYAAERFSKRKNFSEIDSSHLLYFLRGRNAETNFIFSRALLNADSLKKSLKNYFAGLAQGGFSGKFSQNFQDTIIDAFLISRKNRHNRLETGDLLAALAKNDPVFSKVLIDQGLKAEDIENLARWFSYIRRKLENSKKFWDYKNLARRGSLAKQWASGYTVTLDEFGIDWTESVERRGFEEVVGHKETLEQIERVLARIDINNALVVGEPGTGRGEIIQDLAQKCIFGESLPSLNYMRVVELDVPSMLAKIENPEEVEMVLDRIFKEIVSAGNIILVINEFHNFIGQLVRPGVVDISGVLAPYLKAANFQLVAVTTYAGLHKYIEQNPSILSLFEKVEVPEITEQETITLLENMALALENKYKKFVTYPALRDIVFYSAKYIPEAPFPKKAIDLLDEIMIYVSQSTNDETVLPKHVQKVISDKTEIPVGEVGGHEKEKLLNLEELLHQRIVGQEEAVSDVSTAMRRARAEVSIRKGPMGTFLFLGPTGVGKTETSKALAEIYFGSENRMIRLDMSEFQNLSDISRIIGTAQEEGVLTGQIRENPFSLILLDEFEKAHPNVLNLFLQVLDEGRLTDGMGRKADFRNSLIIATSNAGYKIILDALKDGKKMEEIKSSLVEFLFKEGIFRPELLNRFDAVVVFKSLTKDHLLAIADLLLQKLKKNLDDKGINLKITEPLKEKIVELSYSPVFGAREMGRVIQDKVENVLAVALLSEKLKRGDRVEINPEGFQLLINQ